jgi:RNA polymerase sigma-70 factor (ECF subfamily)
LPHLSAVTSGPAQRVAQAYREHRGLVYGLALRYGGGDVAWAEDITQEVFISLMQTIDRLDLQRGLEGWLYRVTTNRCLNRLKVDRFRRSAPIRWVLSQLAPTEVHQGLRIELSAELRRVLGYVQGLPPKQRVAFCMHRLDGLSMSEVGEALGHSKGYVCKLVARADLAVRRAAERDVG